MRSTRAAGAALVSCLAACSVDTILAETHREVPADMGKPIVNGPDAGSALDAAADASRTPAVPASVEASADAASDAADTPDAAPSSVPVEPDASLPPVPCFEGSLIPAPDGCNTCECVAASWTCFQNDCSRISVDCAPGSAQLAADGCNECVCDAVLGWLCSVRAVCNALPGGAYCIVGEDIDGCSCECVNSRFECSCPDWGEPACTPGTRSVHAFDACNICECHETLGSICSSLPWC